MRRVAIATAFLVSLLLLTASVVHTWAWSNGGYSADPSNPDYGTHDWIAEHALDLLPASEKEYIVHYLAEYLYGTELPDNPEGIGDNVKHHIYYDSTGALVDDSAAVRAQEEYHEALGYLNANDLLKAAQTLGVMSHYISDMAVFGHVMGSATDWGAEVHHSDYEDYVNTRTNSYSDDFNVYLSFDGSSLDNIPAYEAAINLAYDTTFDVDGDLTCVWMDSNYDWNNPTFRDRSGESLNLAVNYLADVLHTISVESGVQTMTGGQVSNQIVINEVEQNPPGDDRLSTTMEWVELYNPTSTTVDVGGWSLQTTHGETVTVTIAYGTTLQPNGYCIVERGNWLDNEGESVILRNSGGGEVDRTPIISDTDNDLWSWCRFPNGKDTDSAGDWSFRISTKGSSNGGEVPTKEASSITCSAPSSVRIGGSVTISGLLAPPHAGTTITLLLTPPNSSSIVRTVMAAQDGAYSCPLNPDSVGSWTVKASWPGDGDHMPSESAPSSFMVSKAQCTLELSLSQYEISQGLGVVISGSLAPPRPWVDVRLEYRPEGDSWNVISTVGTGSDGSFSYVWTGTPETTGAYEVRASWKGDERYEGCEKIVKLEVTKLPSSISVEVSPMTLNFGQSVTVRGTVNPNLSQVPVTIVYTRPKEGEIRVQVMTTTTGYFEDSLTPDLAGSWKVNVSWDGDSTYEGAESDTVRFLVNRAPTNIMITLSSESFDEGETITVSGSISPPVGGAPISLEYTLPDGSLISRSSTTTDGSFVDTYTPDKDGEWSVRASWSGDDNHLGAESSSSSFTVRPPFPTAYVSLATIAVVVLGLVIFLIRRRK